VRESSVMQHFNTTTDDTGSAGLFSLSAGVANNCVFTNGAPTTVGGSRGIVIFTMTASAGNGTIINKGGVVSSAGGGEAAFEERGTAATATITN
jgi:hypothetical protein